MSENKHGSSMIWRSTFREIRQSLGRFLAILAIVALGVGFFAGLKVCQSAMRTSMQKYLEETEFHDYRLLSTVGFDDDEIEELKNQPGVRGAEGVITFDIIERESDGTEKVVKMYSIPTDVDKIVLTEGRMPESPDECLLDAYTYTSDAIGTKIALSESNEQDDLDNFAYDSYTVVGLAQTPIFLQYERGTTSLGDGKVSAFAFIESEGFTAEYYTEAVVKFDEDFELYSDEYGDYIDSKQDEWESLVQKLSDARYVRLLDEANTKLSDGKKELSDKKDEAEEELADAKTKLDDVAEEIADGKEQLANAKKEVEDGYAEIEKKEAELEAAEEKISEQESTLGTANIAMGVGVSQAMSQVQGAVDDAVTEFGKRVTGESDSTASLGGSISGLSGSDASAASSQLSDARQQISDGKSQIESAKAQISAGWDQIAAAKKKLKAAETEIAENETKLADAEAEYEDGLAEYEDALEEYNTAIAEAEAKIADGEESLSDLKEQGEATVYVLGRDTNIGYVCFENDSGIVDGIADVFPVFFFLVAALVCMTTMNRMVEEQRTQIGVLKALGYGEATIMMKYLFYSGSAAFLGCVIGFFGGTYGFPKIIWYAYGMMYRAGSLLYVFDWKLGVISVICAMLCSAGTTFVTCRYELMEVSAELMRPRAPKVGKRVLLERVTFIWSRLKFLQKVSLRNIFRYKKRFFMMIVGISGCTALLVTGFGIRDSITNVAAQQYTEIQLYDITATFNDTDVEDEIEELDTLIEAGNISDYCLVLNESVDLVTDSGTKSIYMIAPDPDTVYIGSSDAQGHDSDNGLISIETYLNLHTTSKESIQYPTGDGVVLTHRIAADYDISVGDVITLRDSDYNELTLTVTGIAQNFVYNYAFISPEAIETQLEKEPDYLSAWVNVDENTDLHRAGTKLMKLDGATAVNINQDTMERFVNMMSSLDLIVLVVIVCAAGLAFIVLYNLTNINITERVREIATIKVLGFYENETAAYVFRENRLLTFLGGCLGLLLGIALHSFVMSKIRVDLIVFDVRIRPISYVYSMVLTMVFAAVINRLMRGKLNAVSMTESLKSVD